MLTHSFHDLSWQGGNGADAKESALGPQSYDQVRSLACSLWCTGLHFAHSIPTCPLAATSDQSMATCGLCAVRPQPIAIAGLLTGSTDMNRPKTAADAGNGKLILGEWWIATNVRRRGHDRPPLSLSIIAQFDATRDDMRRFGDAQKLRFRDGQGWFYWCVPLTSLERDGR